MNEGNVNKPTKKVSGIVRPILRNKSPISNKPRRGRRIKKKIWTYRSIVFRVFYCRALRMRPTIEVLLAYYLYDNRLRGRPKDVKRFKSALDRCIKFDYIKKGRGRGLFYHMGLREIRIKRKSSTKKIMWKKAKVMI
ncbi:unnamed protein product [Gordionus sp. m RMFG-2023]